MLLTPGPTPVPEFVRKAMSDITIHHRTEEFEAIFKNTRELLIEIYDMPEVVILASSGTGAMEACVINLTHKKALTVNSGKFGERFGKICVIFLPCLSLSFSKYIINQGGIPEIRVIFSFSVSSTILSTLVSQSSIRLVFKLGKRFFCKYLGI